MGEEYLVRVHRGRQRGGACTMLAAAREDNSMNKTWHAKNRMPAKATLEQRIEWHREHQKNCQCRQIPKSLLEYFKSRKPK
jgi:hypothetical protein